MRAYSSFLVAATVSRARERLRGLDPREIFAAAGRPAWTAAGIVLGLLVALEIAVFRADPAGSSRRSRIPARSFRFPYRYNLVVTSGDRSVLPGESVTVEAMNYGSMRGDATLLVSTIPGVWNRIGVRGDGASPARARNWSVYRHEFGDVREDFIYSFSAGGVRTAEHRVTVIHRPVINGMTAVLKYPPYTGAKADTLEPLAGRIVALAGTRVELEGRTSKPVRDGRLRFASGGTTPLAPAPGGFTAAFTIAANDTFVVETVDSLGFTNDHAVKYPIAALDDAPPSIEIVAPDDGAELPRTLVADLVYRGSDDYGIARVRLFSMRDGKDEDFTAVPVAIPAGAPHRDRGTLRVVPRGRGRISGRQDSLLPRDHGQQHGHRPPNGAHGDAAASRAVDIRDLRAHPRGGIAAARGSRGRSGQGTRDPRAHEEALGRAQGRGEPRLEPPARERRDPREAAGDPGARCGR